ncbi:MAG: hypothetical protein WB562_01305 [Candidatus Sulfotelmatobacter sp.]
MKRNTGKTGKNSTAAVEQQLSEIIDLANSLPSGYYKSGSQKKIAAELGVTRQTVAKHLNPLVKKLRETNPEKFIEGQLKQKEIYELMERALVEGKIPPDVARAWQSIRDSISRLMGYDAPSKSITAHVNGDVDPASMRLWQRAVYELRHIPEAKLASFWERVKPIITELEEREIVLDASYYPPKPALPAGDAR